MVHSVQLCILVVALAGFATGANILFLGTIPSPSHHNWYVFVLIQPCLRELKPDSLTGTKTFTMVLQVADIMSPFSHPMSISIRQKMFIT